MFNVKQSENTNILGKEVLTMSKPKHITAAPAAHKYITISVAEYVLLTQAAALLEVVINDTTYNHEALEAVKVTVQEMAKRAEDGADL